MIQLSIITPCTRPGNLPLLAKSIERARGEFPLKIDWYVCFDGNRVNRCAYGLPETPPFINSYLSYVIDPKSKSGNSQRNFALDFVEEGYIYFLDDDNLMHHNLLHKIFLHYNYYGYEKTLIVNQLDDNWQPRKLGIKYCQPGTIDAAQYVIPKQHLQKRKWATSVYEADGLLIADIARQWGNHFIFTDEIICFYNAISAFHYLNSIGKPMIQPGDLVKVDKEQLAALKALPPNRQLRLLTGMLNKLVDTELEVGNIVNEEGHSVGVIPLDERHPKFNRGNGVNVVFPEEALLHSSFSVADVFGSQYGYERKINFGPQWSSNKHRSGWGYAMSALRGLHKRSGAVLDGFIENSFSWHKDSCLASGTIPYLKPWVGFIHNPPNMPEWFGDGHSSNETIFAQREWKISLDKCKGLFTLSKYHRDALKQIYPNLLIEALKHPTETPEKKFNWKIFKGNPDKLLLQVGWWLRKPFSLYQLEAPGFNKCILGTGNPWQHLMKTHLKTPSDIDWKAVSRLGFQKNEDYDDLLSMNIVFLDLIDSSANNAIIECIVRNTPVVVNKLAPVVEYLGKDYPLYFETLEEADNKLSDLSLIKEAHEYLVEMPKGDLTREAFLHSFANSKIYQNL